MFRIASEQRQGPGRFGRVAEGAAVILRLATEVTPPSTPPASAPRMVLVNDHYPNRLGGPRGRHMAPVDASVADPGVSDVPWREGLEIGHGGQASGPG